MPAIWVKNLTAGFILLQEQSEEIAYLFYSNVYSVIFLLNDDSLRSHVKSRHGDIPMVQCHRENFVAYWWLFISWCLLLLYEST